MGFLGKSSRSNPSEDGFCHWHVEGCYAIDDDDAVSSRELLNLAVFPKGAVSEGDVAQCGECRVESCRAILGCVLRKMVRNATWASPLHSPHGNETGRYTADLVRSARNRMEAI